MPSTGIEPTALWRDRLTLDRCSLYQLLHRGNPEQECSDSVYNVSAPQVHGESRNYVHSIMITLL